MEPQLVDRGKSQGRSTPDPRRLVDIFGVGIGLGHGLLHQPQRRPLRPGVQRRARQTAPPGLAGKAHGPGWPGLGQGNQAVTATFFWGYAGSGLVIHPLARCQRTPCRANVRRIVSPLTRVGVRPSADARRMAELPRRAMQQRPQPFRPGRIEGRTDGVGREEPAWSTTTPAPLRAGMALRTVCSLQQRPRAMAARARRDHWPARSGSSARGAGPGAEWVIATTRRFREAGCGVLMQ